MVDFTHFRKELLLSEEDKQGKFWFHDELHLPNAMTPLFASYMVRAISEGTKKAFETLKLPIDRFHVKLSDSHFYQCSEPYEGDVQARMEEHIRTVGGMFPVLSDRFWGYIDHEFIPYFEKIDNDRKNGFTLSEAREIVEELYTFYLRAWELHFEVAMPRGSIGIALEDTYKALTGDPNTTYVYDLLEGVMNKSLETDRAIWNLAKSVKQNALLADVFASTDNSEDMALMLGQTAAGRSFLASVQGMLEVYGWRTGNSHEFKDEIWIENPKYVLTMINEYVKKESYDFDEEYAQVVAERERKVAELLASNPDNEAKGAFKQVHEWALKYWGIDEDHHFYIDAMLPAKARLLLLEVGNLLVQAGAIQEPSDVFFLYLDELVEVVDHPVDVTVKVAENKARYEVDAKKAIPPFFGQPPQEEAPPVIERVFGTKAPQIDEQKQSFKGYAASKGVHTGIVKVVRDQNDFRKIQKGDVLVCKTTMPPWTVLFSIAGAVITDAGGILSHAGTVAREYKLPAVLGTKVATQLLKDGDLVKVDGTEGVVYIEQL